MNDGAADPGESAARERLERLFAGFDRLTPDELARVGIRPAGDAERDHLLAAVDAAAERTGRVALVDEARAAARDVVLRRYAVGALHPTWVGLNWGISQGTVEDRVAVVETLADAAAAAVVGDALDPDVADALALDAAGLVGLAAGSASDGALGRVLQQPSDPDLGASPTGRRLRVGVAILVVVGTAFTVGVGIAAGVGAILAAAAAVLVVLVVRRPAAGDPREDAHEPR